MTPETREDLELAQAVLESHRIQARFIAAWLLGELMDTEKQALWRSADTLALRPLLEELACPETAESYRLLLDAVQCLVRGRSKQQGLTKAVGNQAATVVLQECRRRLFDWLKNLGITLPPTSAPKEASQLLHYVAGSTAVQRFHQLEKEVMRFRQRLKAEQPTAIDRAILMNFPDAAEVAADGEYARQMSYRVFAWRRLLGLCRERSSPATPPERRWSLAGGFVATFTKWAATDPDKIVDVLKDACEVPESESGVSHKVGDLLGADPQPEPTRLAKPTLPPLTQAWTEGPVALRRLLSKYPLVRVALRRANLSEQLEEAFVDFISANRPAKEAETPSLSKQFSALLTRFAEQHNQRLASLPAWDSLLEEAAVVKVLEQRSESELDWVTAFKRLARERNVVTVAGLATLEFDRTKYTKTAAFDTFRQSLKVEAVGVLAETTSLDW